MVRFWDVVEIEPVGGQEQCWIHQGCSSCLSQVACVFVWNLAGKGMCIDEANEEEFSIGKLASHLGYCPLIRSLVDKSYDIESIQKDLGMSPTFLEG
jgi:hypothetical protein